MPAKLALDKKAWEWALKRSLDKISEEDINTAYRVSLPSCKPGNCRYACCAAVHVRLSLLSTCILLPHQVAF